MSTLRTVFGALGIAAGFMLFAFPVFNPIMRIVVNKDTGQLSGMPYYVTLLSCLLSLWYATPFVSQNNTALLVLNGIGAVFEATYVLAFLLYSPRNHRNKIYGLLFGIIIISAGDVLISYFALHGQTRKIVAGIITGTVSILMYGSPLTVVRTVVNEKSVESMPLSLSLFSFLCATCWFVYGILGSDYIVAIPNGIGCLLGIVQLSLYAFYFHGRNMQTSDEASVELGQGK
ncbi:Bidirectional sugar transporter SWEET [Heracleum sosnowskyi]|uniref:Bidirectional sugar transporter SWEET n=1 Tax=Heracleum sosnowskyi TaxID=360622 RepID=A0AAD8M421_9APIA|nr:Bidirectional sugar transporter SWEET [Heracleum sosnowskyi]